MVLGLRCEGCFAGTGGRAAEREEEGMEDSLGALGRGEIPAT